MCEENWNYLRATSSSTTHVLFIPASLQQEIPPRSPRNRQMSPVSQNIGAVAWTVSSSGRLCKEMRTLCKVHSSQERADDSIYTPRLPMAESQHWHVCTRKKYLHHHTGLLLTLTKDRETDIHNLSEHYLGTKGNILVTWYYKDCCERQRPAVLLTGVCWVWSSLHIPPRY